MVAIIEPYINAARNRTATARKPNVTATARLNETSGSTRQVIVKDATRFDPPVDTKRWGPGVDMNLPGVPGAVPPAELYAPRNTLQPPRREARSR